VGTIKARDQRCSRLAPTQELAEATDWTSPSTGDYHTCAVKTDGTLWCWGANGNGRLGDNTTTARHLPTQEFTAATDWALVSAGSSHTCAVKTDNTLWCWGFNGSRSLGDNTTTDRHLPTQEVTAATDWASVSAGSAHTCAVKTDGTLWCWGNDTFGRLGDNSTQVHGSRGVPVQEHTAATDWASVSAADEHTCAMKTNGTLWCWGSGSFGRLGNNTTFHRRFPVQEFTAATDWAAVSAAHEHTCAVKTNGTLWCWGSNTEGQLTTTRNHRVPGPVFHLP
jgi:alpha-tubulin suppressor-like RCC1 family protein